jgi:hypothetical protein
MAMTINKNYNQYKNMPTEKLTQLLNKEFDSKTNNATIHTLMQGIKSTRNYLKETL